MARTKYFPVSTTKKERSSAAPQNSSATGSANDSYPKTVVDLSKLRKSSLKRYRRHFKLEVKSNPSKAELLAVVVAHFSQMPVREAEVMSMFDGSNPTRKDLLV